MKIQGEKLRLYSFTKNFIYEEKTLEFSFSIKNEISEVTVVYRKMLSENFIKSLYELWVKDIEFEEIDIENETIRLF